MALEGTHIYFEIGEVSSGVSFMLAFNNGFLILAIGKLSSEVFTMGETLQDWTKITSPGGVNMR